MKILVFDITWNGGDGGDVGVDWLGDNHVIDSGCV